MTHGKNVIFSAILSFLRLRISQKLKKIEEMVQEKREDLMKIQLKKGEDSELVKNIVKRTELL